MKRIAFRFIAGSVRELICLSPYALFWYLAHKTYPDSFALVFFAGALAASIEYKIRNWKGER